MFSKQEISLKFQPSQHKLCFENMILSTIVMFLNHNFKDNINLKNTYQKDIILHTLLSPIKFGVINNLRASV